MLAKVCKEYPILEVDSFGDVYFINKSYYKEALSAQFINNMLYIQDSTHRWMLSLSFKTDFNTGGLLRIFQFNTWSGSDLSVPIDFYYNLLDIGIRIHNDNIDIKSIIRSWKIHNIVK